MLVVDVHNLPAELSSIIIKQQDDFNYIFPRQSNVSPPSFGRSNLQRYACHIGQCAHRVTTSQPPLSQHNHHFGYPRHLFHWTCSFCHSTSGPLPISSGTSWRTYSWSSKGNACSCFNSCAFLLLCCYYLIVLGIVLCSPWRVALRWTEATWLCCKCISGCLQQQYKLSQQNGKAAEHSFPQYDDKYISACTVCLFLSRFSAINFTDSFSSNGGPGNEQPLPTPTLDLSLLEDDWTSLTTGASKPSVLSL